MTIAFPPLPETILVAKRSRVFIRGRELRCFRVRDGTQTGLPIHEHEQGLSQNCPEARSKAERRASWGQVPVPGQVNERSLLSFPELSLRAERVPPPWSAIVVSGRKGRLDGFRKILPEKAVVSEQLGFISFPPWVWVPQRGSLLQKLQTQLPEVKSKMLRGAVTLAPSG